MKKVYLNVHFHFQEVLMNTNKRFDVLIKEFLAYKRVIGYQYITGERYLNEFRKYIQEKMPETVLPNKNIILKYLDTKKQVPGSLYGIIAVLREFSRYLINQGYQEVYVIPPKRSPKLCPEHPYFFTQDEIQQFFQECDSIKVHPSFKGRHLVLPTLFRLLYCCGLRCKEARMLLCTDVHFEDGYLDIIQSKGTKSRRIFITNELQDYLAEYEFQIKIMFPNRTYFFPHTISKHYDSGFITGNFRRIWKKTYPNFKEGFTRPRAYDLRHHFVWANLNSWAEEGKDVNAMLPYLVNYMGHQHLSSTLYYFHFVPEFFSAYTEITKNLEDILPEVQDEEEK